MKEDNSVKVTDTSVTQSPKVSVSHGLDWYYLQYILVTGLYMLEPWERAIFNCFVVGCATIALYFLTKSLF